MWVENVTDGILLDAICQKRGGLVGASGNNARVRRIPRTWARGWISDKPRNKKRDRVYYNISMGFDIETTLHKKSETAYMYIWQLAINDLIIFGTEWTEFFNILLRIKNIIKPASNGRVIIWVHNLAYEYQFIKRHVTFGDDYFFTATRTPIYFVHDGFFEFKDSLQITRSSLAKLAKDYTITQKMVGDLDYDIMRNKSDARKMTDAEYGYCENDVKILSEFADYFYNKYLKNHYNPPTQSSILRAELKAGMSEKDKIDVADAYPATYDLYHYITGDVYRGGYVHGNICYTGITLTPDIVGNITGIDFTSSYPAWMLTKYFPGKFTPYDGNVTEKRFKELAKSQCVIATFAFYGLKNKMPHSIESVSKCLNKADIIKDKRSVIDNGRILQAHCVVVRLCDLDFMNYNMFYDWDFCIISEVYTAPRQKLPDYVIKPMLKYYVAKGALKEAGKPYSEEKVKVNTFYGVLVTRINTETYQIDNSGDAQAVEGFDYGKIKEKAFLLPQWGVYVSAWARHELLKMVARLELSGYHVMYCDTDSIKAIGWNAGADAIINRYNENNHAAVASALKYYNVEPEHIITKNGGTIGDFDTEYTALNKFKMQGAKRYILEDRNGHFKSTIAGLPKKAYWRMCRQIRSDPFEAFEDGFTVRDCKLASIYNDNPTSALIHGEYMTEESSVALVPIDFTMGLKEDFLQLIEYFQTLEGKEVR